MAPAGVENKSAGSSVRRALHSASSGDGQVVGDRDAGAGDDDHVREGEDLAPTVPRRQPAERVGAQQQPQRPLREFAPQFG